MKKIFVLYSILILSFFSAFGQENALYVEVEQAKEASTYFENVVLKKVSADVEALKNFINPDEVSFFENNSFNSRNNETKAISLSIPFKNKDLVLELIEVPEYFYDYEIITSDWEIFAANKDIKHFRGVVKDDKQSLVAITFYEDEIMGLVATNEGNFNIVKNKQSGKHLFYNDKNLKEKMDWVCGTEDDLSVTYDREILFEQQSDLNNSRTTKSSVINKFVRFFVETEYDIYQDKGSVSSVEAYILGLFNQVAVIYQNENISTVVFFLYICTSNASYPYTGKNTTADLLDQFKKTRTSIIGDLGMLLTFRNIGGGRAVLDGLCSSSTKNKLGVVGLNKIYNILPVPTYSWNVSLVAHELGHLFGSQHTHACVWNGNKTAIDGCCAVEGTCSRPPKPVGGGTIMSYCDLDGGPGINFNLGFGSQPGNLIRNKVSNANCLFACKQTFSNETYSSGTYNILGCAIEISNSTVSSNATLKVFGRESVVIKPGFKANAGSNVKIGAGAQPQWSTPFSSLKNLTYNDENEFLEELTVKSPGIAGIDFFIYPNPNDGNFIVKITGELQPYTLEIFNNLGELLGFVNSNDETLNINRTDLSAGIYFAKLTMNGKIALKKIVVQ